MKSNEALGFKPLYELQERADYEDKPITINAEIGRKGDVYRVYAYTYFHDRDASKEGVIETLAARDETPEQAVQQFVLAARSQKWEAKAVDRVAMEMRENLADLAS